jgi:nucleoside-diphosphate-sugar epimerase
MNNVKKIALIAGATGVVGRSILQHLSDLEDWEVIAISRRRPDIVGDYQHIEVDLLDKDDCRDKLGNLLNVSHIFYAAYVERPSLHEMVEPNLKMLVNLVDVVEPIANRLQHINLMHGTKWYGNHLGPFKTPAKESDPPHMPPNFYYDQQRFIVDRQKGNNWTWSSARPHGVSGFAIGNPMNLVMIVAVYATISKALGLPLRHPGSRANAHALYQVTDSGLLARACTWMVTEEKCANESFNITNGDIFRWEDMWPIFAEYFNMKTAQPQKINLTQMMADKRTLWDGLINQYGLQNIPYEKLLRWEYGDFVFTPEFDIISSTTKARQFGFNEVMDSEEMFLRQFDELRANKIIP